MPQVRLLDKDDGNGRLALTGTRSALPTTVVQEATEELSLPVVPPKRRPSGPKELQLRWRFVYMLALGVRLF